MKKTILSVFALLGLASLTPMNAHAYGILEANCTSQTATADSGYVVNIVTLVSLPIGHPAIRRTTAALSKQTIAGPQLIQAYAVEKSVPTQILGAPESFQGPGFDLEILVDATPVNGLVPARLTADLGSAGQITEELLCKNY